MNFAALILLLSLSSFAQSNEEILANLRAQAESKSIAEAVASLPEGMRKNHVLMFESRSLQQGSFLAPRVILFNENSSLILSFNGDRSQRGYESIETIRFIEDEARFIFEEIVFGKDLEVRKQVLIAEQDEFQLEAIVKRTGRTGPNASMCLGCHRSDPRPNWEAYPMWPGAYGQDADRLGSTTTYNQNGTDNLPIMGAKELEEFPKFLKLASEHPRYASLLELSKHYSKKRGETGLNTFFSRNLATLNNQRIARILTQNPAYPEFKDKLLEGLFPKPGKYVPPYRDNIGFYKLLQSILPPDIYPSLLSMSLNPRAESLSFMTPDNFTEELFLAWKVRDPSIVRPTYP